jgi:predicted negative regulator of RcsB-dependent stress response
MSDQTIINLIVGVVLSVLGWFARQLWDAVQDLKNDMKEIEIDLPTHYVRKDELEQRFNKIEDMLNSIFEKLDNKADK